MQQARADKTTMTASLKEPLQVRSVLLTLVFTDLVDSVGLKSRLGDAEADHVIATHHAAVRDLVNLSGGRQILVAGDGCFLTFDTPTQAVEFALNLQDFHRENAAMPHVRVGIHMGEVTERVTAGRNHQTVDVMGLAVDIAARIQGVAEPRQILMSYPVFDNARQRLDSALWPLPVEWRAHGRYVFQGSDMSLEVYEVGLKGVAPFEPPAGDRKAHRDVRDEEEETLGWRPAQGLEVPRRPHWVLAEKLGEGGFGDVWLVEHTKTLTRRVIKFCYSADRLRTLKREVTLFRLLKDTLGNRQDIARVLDFDFEQAPYFLEMEYVSKLNLGGWVEARGGAQAVPLELRLEIIAQVAEAIAAAHSVGVIHKDIKPSNIMVLDEPDGNAKIKVIDFGVGALQDTGILENKGITFTGLTETDSPDGYSSLMGTRLYMAPELIEGKTASTKSDIYSLGVLLYQMVAGKFGQTLAPGWERDVADPLLREDIACCVDGTPENRLKTADDLAWRLRHLPQRHRDIEERRRAAELDEERRRWMHRVRIFTLVGSGVVVGLLLLFGLYAHLMRQTAHKEAELRHSAEAARELAEEEQARSQKLLKRAQQARYQASIALAEASLRESRYEQALQVLIDDPTPEEMRREWGWLLAKTSPEDFAIKNYNVYDAKFLPGGQNFVAAHKQASSQGYVAQFSALTAQQTTTALTNYWIVWNLAVSPDGKRVATASREPIIAFLDLESNKVVQKLKGHSAIIRDVEYRPDGLQLASCARDQSLRLWDLQTMKQSHLIELTGLSPTEVSYSPDSAYIVVGSLEGRVSAYDTATGERVCGFNGVQGKCLSLTFTRNGKAVAVADAGGLVHFYHWPPQPDEAELEPYMSTKSQDTYPVQVISSVDGDSVFVGDDNGRITRRDTATGEEQMRFTVDQPLWKLDLSPDGKSMLTVARWSLRLIDLNRVDNASTATVVTTSTVLPADVTTLTVASMFMWRNTQWSSDDVWKTPEGQWLVDTNRGKNFLVRNRYVTWSPDERQRVTIDRPQMNWHVEDVQSGRILYEDRASSPCVGVEFSPDGKQCAILTEDHFTTVFNTATWERRYTVQAENSAPATVRFTPDSTRLIVGENSGIIRIYNASNGEMLKEIAKDRAGMPLDMDFSPDGSLLAVGVDLDRAYVYNLSTGDVLSTLTGHVRYVHGVKFTADGERVATLSRDGTVKLWDVPTGRELVTLFSFKNDVVPLAVHFEPGGRAISVVTSDKRILSNAVFPWNLAAYGNSSAPLEEKVERWKRRTRLGLNTNGAPDAANPK